MTETINPATPVAPSNKIKVMIITMDSGTSERWACEAEVDQIAPGQIIKAYEKDLAEHTGDMAPDYGAHVMRWWLPKGSEPCCPATFVLEAFDPYFGTIRVVGFVEEIK